MSDYEIYIAELKKKLIDFDFSDCPPAKQLAEALTDFWLTTDNCTLAEVTDTAMYELEKWKKHAYQVLTEE